MFYISSNKYTINLNTIPTDTINIARLNQSTL